MENNQAFVAKIGNLSKIEGADKIVRADILLKGIPVTQIVTGVDTQEGATVVYFDSNMCLEETTILKDYEDLATYLGSQGRVKVVKLKNTISNGLAVDVEKFYKYFRSKELAKQVMVEGYSFVAIENTHICHKYLPPAPKVSGTPKKKGRKGRVISRMIPGLFNFHTDTAQLARNLEKIDPESVISISHKWHGTSAIASYLPVKRKLSLVDKLAKLVGVKVDETSLDLIWASRTVVKNGAQATTGFYKEDIWGLTAQKYFKDKLAVGETVYYEVVGYLPSGSFIQKSYDYGCKPGDHKVVVYRITKTSTDGHVTEYGWQAMKGRCKELGVDPVREFYFGKAKDLFSDLSVSEHWHENFIANLRKTYLEKDLEGNLCKKVPDEGIVLRVEGLHVEPYKLKSEKFFLLASQEEEKGTVDLEAIEASQ